MDKLLSLDPLILPPEPSYWPLPSHVWIIIAAAVISTLLLLALRRYQASKSYLHRKALLELSRVGAHRDTASLHRLLRRIALTHFPRHTVAPMSGEAWLRWLDKTLPEPRFMPLKAVWLAGLYQDQQPSSQDWHQCIHASEAWINTLYEEQA
ncbi:DUF4381 domain-containing protein [Thaumasiovibrio subtropicus]|uniref:DUF4381 domain-containing protein n=1 Tax=Thaumasiovibrio subtropicus TaxID=1891207 RepID=UPI000B34DB0F|nr:DUF4381 domain-containing protein [Thaumasiovibrio subtropicus]